MANFTHYRVGADLQTPIMDGASDAIPGRFLADMRDKMKIKIISWTEDDLVFDLIGVDPSIANALRRILLAEVPTVAIENVWISVNTSIIQDEVLAHRIGLIPIKVDPQAVEYLVAEGEETDSDTIVFHLDYLCGPAPNADEDHSYTESVLSSHLTWVPQGSQEERFPEGIAPVHNDIVIAKLRPGQRIEFEAHCHKGIGKDHTKFSPVATASYRLLPDIVLQQPITGPRALELQALCPMGVFDIEDVGGIPSAKVARPRDCTMCRECIRTDGWGERVALRRVADHFIFSVESSGCISPVVAVKEALSVLKGKARKFQTLVAEYESQL